MILDVKLNNKKEKCFVFKNSNDYDLNNLDLIDFPLNQNVSFTNMLKTDNSGKLFIKVTPSKHGANSNKKLKFFLREVISERFLLTIRSLKEYRGSKKLAKIGINTPKVIVAGYFLSNIKKYNGIIVYERLDNVVTAQEILLTSTDIELKRNLLKLIELDYKKMAMFNVHFRDLHMSNILVDTNEMKLYWIDPGLSRIAKFL